MHISFANAPFVIDTKGLMKFKLVDFHQRSVILTTNDRRSFSCLDSMAVAEHAKNRTCHLASNFCSSAVEISVERFDRYLMMGTRVKFKLIAEHRSLMTKSNGVQPPRARTVSMQDLAYHRET